MIRNKLITKLVCIAILLAFLSVSIFAALPEIRANAETAQEKLDNSIKKQNELQKDIDRSQQQKSKNLADKQIIDKEISELQSTIDTLNQSINESDKKIAVKEVELAEAQKKCDEQYESYCDRARLLLEKGSISYLQILIEADSFEDFLTRAALVQEIAEYDNNKLKELQKHADKVESLKAELEDEKALLVDLKKEEDSKMATLKTKQSQSQQIIDNLTRDIAAFEKALEAQERAEAAARAEIARLSSGSSSTQYTGGAFCWPSVSTTITSPYGTRTHPITGKVKTHTGLDIGAAHGTNIFAAADGTVLISGWNSGGYGNYVVIDHGGGLTTLYAHCSSLLVSAGQKVSRGQVIAKCGSTGMSTGPHLHFEVLKNGNHTNPWAYLN